MADIEDALVIGDFNTASHDHAIVIGVGAHSQRDYEFCIKVGNVEMREIMTPEEQEIFYSFFKRMFKNNTLGPKGIME